MYKPKSVYKWDDLLVHASTMNYDWNRAHTILECVHPAVVGLKTVLVEEWELEDKIHGDDATLILKSFFEAIGNPNEAEFV